MMEGRPMGPTVWYRAIGKYRDVLLVPSIFRRFVAPMSEGGGAIMLTGLVTTEIFEIPAALSGDKGKFTADES